MLKLDIPGSTIMELQFLVLDYNGTIACDGRLIPGVMDRITDLAKSLSVHILTADTFGSVRTELNGIPCETAIIPKGKQAEAKAKAEKEQQQRALCPFAKCCSTGSGHEHQGIDLEPLQAQVVDCLASSEPAAECVGRQISA